MNTNVLVVLVIVLAGIFGGFIGVQVFKFKSRKLDKQILENAQEVLDGKRENTIIIDGQKYDATKFKVRDDNDKEIVIDLKGGESVENGRTREEDSKEEVSGTIRDEPTLGEDSISPRRKKRSLKSIFRRFG